MDEDYHTIRTVAQRFVKGLGIGGLAIVASLGLAGRVNATYFYSDGAHASAGEYIDREWYYLLDDGQYYYLERGQYNLLGELGYLLGHSCYPKLFERDLDQAVGFTNRVNTAWFSVSGGQVPIIEYAVWSYHFNAGDYIDRGRYYFLIGDDTIILIESNTTGWEAWAIRLDVLIIKDSTIGAIISPQVKVLFQNLPQLAFWDLGP